MFVSVHSTTTDRQQAEPPGGFTGGEVAYPSRFRLGMWALVGISGAGLATYSA
jgi:hypothetical protein